MFSALRASKLLDTLRELDLGALQREAEARFYLSVVGDPSLAQPLAELLSATPERSGVHPWVRVSPAYPSAYAPAPDLLIAVTQDTGPLEPALTEPAVRGRVPLLRVCVGEGVNTAALTPVGAELPRPGEAARVLLPSLEPEAALAALIPALLRALPSGRHLALARQLPSVRKAVIRDLVETTSRANALYAASSGMVGIVPALNLPVNLADTVVLSKNQLLMAYKVALAAGKTGRAQEILAEAVGVLGGGLLFRQVARGLVGLVPVWGIIPKVAVAYAGTWVIGQAAELWATQGRVATAGELKPLYTQALTRGRTLARSLLPTRRGRPALPSPRTEAEAAATVDANAEGSSEADSRNNSDAPA